MEYTQVLGFIFITLLLVVSPGPNGLLIAKTVPASGKKTGFANIAGFVGAFVVHGLLSIFGLSVLLTNSADAFFIVKVLGALYLSWVGIKSLISALKYKENIIPEAAQSKNTTLLKAFIEGLLTNGLNPKVSMFYLAAFPQFIPVGEHSVMYAIMLVSTHALINVIWFSIMVMLFAKLTTAAKNENFQRILKGVTGVIFVGFGAKLLALENK